MPQPKNRVALVGTSGYAGAEALRLLHGHPDLRLTGLYAHAQAGRPLEEVLPPFTGLGLPDLRPFDADEIAQRADFVLLAVPHGTAQEASAALLARGLRVVDFSADHRFERPEDYAAIYGKAHARPENLAQTVYGLPELNRARIREAQLVGAAGCFPTSVILAAAPAQRAGLLAQDEIIADSKTGVSGAGRTASERTHYPETTDGVRAYGTLSHRHAPEMSLALGRIQVHFVPHLVPMIRGILSTVYLRLKPGLDLAQVRALYTAHYADEPFVHVLAEGVHPDPRHVRGTNRCHLGLFMRGDLLVVQAAIDNLGKGAAGQAVQCLNLMAGLAEDAGLRQTALFP